ncbi:MAG: Asp-tRNA(Asn)/Glu-tRNA(Gln) amidotransferase subunit GatA [Planctomycetota bacterium]
MTADLTAASAIELASMIRAGEHSAAAVVEAFLARIEALNPRVNALVEVFAAESRAAAESVDRARANGDELGPLAGVPVVIKDVFNLRGQLSSCASHILEGYRSPYTATAVQRLQDAGAIIIGRSNMDEFAMGSSTEHSIYGATHNPFNLDRSPGGSSGGSAAAVSARFAPLALGSDTGGSVRQPAAFCGIPGFKPTYGRISRFGLIAFASSLDHVAPFARSVEDLALCTHLLAGEDENDSTSLAAPVPDYLESCGRSLQGMRIGLPEEYFAEGLDPEIETLTRAAIKQLEDLGAEAVSVSLPHTRYAIPSYYLLCTSEASSNLARYDGVRYGLRAAGDRSLEEMYAETRGLGFGSEVKLRILLGTFCLCSGYYDEYYLKASKMRTLMRRDFAAAFENCDLLATPTTPTAAFKLGEKLADPLSMYLSDILTVSANLAGIPAISVPCGFTSQGLPAGLQILGPTLDEARVLQAAAAFQNVNEHHLVAPGLEAQP